MGGVGVWLIGCSDGDWKIPSENFVGEEGSDVGFASGFLGRGCLICLVLYPSEELLFVGWPGALVAMQVWGCQVAAVRVASLGNDMAPCPEAHFPLAGGP